ARTTQTQQPLTRPTFDRDPIGPGILEAAGIPEDIEEDGTVGQPGQPPVPAPLSVQLSRPDDGSTPTRTCGRLSATTPTPSPSTTTPASSMKCCAASS